MTEPDEYPLERLVAQARWLLDQLPFRGDLIQPS
jgi:hypothetical protein